MDRTIGKEGETKKKRSIGLAILLLFLFLFGLLIAWATIPPIVTAIQQRTWNKTSCTIESSKLLTDESGTSLLVEYTYLNKGKTQRSKNYAIETSAVISDEEMTADADRLKPGTTAPCWLSNGEPVVSVLRRERLDTIIVLIFPLFLIPGSLIAAKFIWFPAKPKSKSYAGMEEKDEGRGCSINFGIFCFFGLFVAVGLGLTYLFFLRHYLAARQMASWREITCTIESSEAGSHTTKDNDGKSSTSYSFDVRYSYDEGGKRFVGTQYNPAQGSYSSYSAVSELDRKFAEGTVVPCFVNPEDVLESALAREMPTDAWYGLFPMIFAFAGFFGWFHVLGEGRGTSNRRSPTGKISKKAASRFGGTIKLIFAAILWNGIVAAVLFAAGQAWMKGTGSIFPLLILIPFALIGILMLISIPYSILQIFNPTLDLELQLATPEPGAAFSVGYRLNGNPRRVRRMEIVLELWSVARTTSNSDIKRRNVDRVLWKPLVSLPLISTDRAQSFVKGIASVRVPDVNELPIRSPGETLQWKLRWKLKIPLFPDASEILEVGAYRGSAAIEPHDEGEDDLES